MPLTPQDTDIEDETDARSGPSFRELATSGYAKSLLALFIAISVGFVAQRLLRS